MTNYNENDIRTAAYFNWLNSGCQNGNDLQNWNNALLQFSAKTSCSKTCSKFNSAKAKSTTTKSSVKKSKK